MENNFEFSPYNNRESFELKKGIKMFRACPSCVRSGYPLQIRPRSCLSHFGFSAAIPHATKKYCHTSASSVQAPAQRHS